MQSMTDEIKKVPYKIYPHCTVCIFKWFLPTYDGNDKEECQYYNGDEDIIEPVNFGGGFDGKIF